MTSWINARSGQVVKPSDVQYESLTFSSNTSLVWPTESTEGANYVASWINGTATSGGLSLLMPNAKLGSTGVAAVISNVGSNTFSVKSSSGMPIISIDPGVVWIVILTDNSTTSGSWSSVQLGATVSQAEAEQLAGLGLEAVLGKLQVSLGTRYVSSNGQINPDDRATGLVWTGATGNLVLDPISSLTAGWWCLITNRGSDVLTITGSETINGQSSFEIPNNPDGAPYSTMVIASSTGFNTFGGNSSLIPISGGGTGARTAPQALSNLGGTELGTNIFTAPTAAAVLSLLGILPTAFKERTVGTTQNLSASSVSSAFVCTTALSINMMDSTTVENTFLFAVYAHGGDVTLSPAGSDAINGQASGASFVIPRGSSAIVITDANGAWWTFCFYRQAWVAAGGSADAITASFTPALPFVIDGTVVNVRAAAANTSATPTLQVDSNTARTITKRGGQALVAGDIPGANYECIFRYNLANTRWELLNPATAWLDYFGSTQGDILFRGASVWGRLAIGTNGYVLFSNGTAPYWAANVPQRLHRAVFTSSGSWTVPAGTDSSTVFRIYGCAGGGGGGASTGGGNGNGAPGGGSGAFADITAYGFTAGQVATITIGAAGTHGDNNVNSGNAGNGGNSLFQYNSSSIMTLSGGIGGVGVGGGGGADGGLAGTVSLSGGGVLTIESQITSGAEAGERGAYLGNSVAYGGSGGSNPLGEGGGTRMAGPSDNNRIGYAATGYGGGGGGGATSGGSSAFGGDGTAGIIIIEWVL